MPPDVRAAVIACESGGDPTAQNKESTASGLYQFVNGTWKTFGGSTARAREASTAEQHAVADRAYAANGLKDWEASRSCWAGKVGKHSSGQEPSKHARTRAPRHAKHEDKHAEPAAKPTSYTVRSGDTLGGIAKAHGTTWRKLLAANCGTITDPDRIYIGQRIAL